MATLAPSSPSASPPFHRRRKSWARKIERVCCSTLSLIPLCFVYGLTTWAVWVEVSISFLDTALWLGYLKAGICIVFYVLAVVSYTIAVFTPAGSPLDARRDGATLGRRKGEGYASLPTYEDEEPREASLVDGMSTVMAKSTGKQRYCKKCQSVKPDRTHHCSSCGTCVLKMDHHCPWLATCVGLRNYKAFLLFLVYTTLFCWVDFAVSARWVWAEIADDRQMSEGLMVINTIMLAVLGGIIGLVLGGFTGWHLYLAVTGQTTIESLEKNRYISPLKQSMQQSFHAPNSGRTYLNSGNSTNNSADHQTAHIGGAATNTDQTLTDQLKEIHANAVPGVFRPEEGESTYPSSTPSPAPPTQLPTSSQQPSAYHQTRQPQNYNEAERQREHDRYAAYLDEQDSAKLPNAFDLGWRANLAHLFGSSPLFWALPVCNTTGDGWRWEVSPTWVTARDEVRRAREASEAEALRWRGVGQGQSQSRGGSGGTTGVGAPPKRDLKWTPGMGFVDRRPLPPQQTTSGMLSGRASPVRRAPPQSQLGGDAARDLQLQPLDRRKSGSSGEYDTSSSDEDWNARSRGQVQSGATANWNDLPEEFLAPRSGRGGFGAGNGRRSRSRGRRKGD